MSTFPILYLYNPEDKRDKEAISQELCCSYEERHPWAINSFFLKKSLREFMWIVTVKRGERYNWNLHSTLQPSFKPLEVVDVSNDM